MSAPESGGAPAGGGQREAATGQSAERGALGAEETPAEGAAGAQGEANGERCPQGRGFDSGIFIPSDVNGEKLRHWAHQTSFRQFESQDPRHFYSAQS